MLFEVLEQILRERVHLVRTVQRQDRGAALILPQDQVFIVGFLPSIPPPAAERLKQPGGIGISVGLRLTHANSAWANCELRVHHRHRTAGTELPLMPNQVPGLPRRALRIDAGTERIRIRLERPQRVGDILACQDDGRAILGAGLIQGCVGRPLLVQEGAGIKQRLSQRGAGIPNPV